MSKQTPAEQFQAYQAAQQAAAVFDLSTRDELTLTGADRVSFLQGFCTNDVKRLPVGGVCEAFIPNVKGRTLGHVFISAGVDQLTLDSVAQANETLLPHLDRYLIVEDVELKSTTADRRLFFVTGPKALQVISQVWPDAAALPPNAFIEVSAGEFPVTVRRVDWLGQPGFQIRVPAENGETVQSQIVQAGAVVGDESVWEAVRLEACLPDHGRDFSEDNLAQEVDRTEAAISFHKGCYLGQEPIARIDALGHVNWLLRGLKLELPEDADPAEISGAELKVDGQEKPVGTVRSVAAIPCESGESPGRSCVAMAIVRREQSVAETVLQLETKSGAVPVTVFWR